MNKSNASRIAETITNEQLKKMLDNAKESIKDWTKVSSVNKGATIGVTWNILAKDFDVSERYHFLAKRNMIWEFGDYLTEDFSIKKPKRKLPKNIIHQEPKFKL